MNITIKYDVNELGKNNHIFNKDEPSITQKLIYKIVPMSITEAKEKLKDNLLDTITGYQVPYRLELTDLKSVENDCIIYLKVLKK